MSTSTLLLRLLSRSQLLDWVPISEDFTTCDIFFYFFGVPIFRTSDTNANENTEKGGNLKFVSRTEYRGGGGGGNRTEFYSSKIVLDCLDCSNVFPSETDGKNRRTGFTKRFWVLN